MKIGRYEFDINEKDIIMDNRACYQLVTRRIGLGFRKLVPIVSKSQFNKLLKNKTIYKDRESNEGLTRNGNEFILTYYKFDMDKIKE